MRKFLAIFLTVAMLASFAVVPALAAVDGTEKLAITLNPSQVVVFKGEDDQTVVATVHQTAGTTLANGDEVYVGVEQLYNTNSATAKASVAKIDWNSADLTANKFKVTIEPVKAGISQFATYADLVTGVAKNFKTEIRVDVKDFADYKIFASDGRDYTGKPITVGVGKTIGLSVPNLPTGYSVKFTGKTLGGGAITGAEGISVVDNTVLVAPNFYSINNRNYAIKVEAQLWKGTTELTTIAPLETYIFVGDASSAPKLTSLKIKNPGTSTMVTGEILPLTLVKTPSNAGGVIGWFSTDTSVAVVEQDGVVNAVGTGTATISVYSDNGLMDSITLTVYPGVIPTTVVIKDSNALSIVNDLTGVLQPTLDVTPINGKKDGTWRFVYNGQFGNGGLAEIDANTGKITIKTPASDLKNNNTLLIQVQVLTTSGVVTRTAAVTVTGYKTADFVTITNGPTFNTLLIGQEYKLEAAAKMNDGTAPSTSDIQFYSERPEVASVDIDTGVVKGLKEGTALITAKDVVSGKSAIMAITVKAKVSAADYKVVSAATVKVRALASSTSTELGKLVRGTSVEVLAVEGAWTKIVYVSSVGNSYAYVASAALAPLGDVQVISNTLAVRTNVGDKIAIDTLKFGDTVKVIGVYAPNPAWLKILYKNNTEAYIAAAYVKDAPLTGVVTSNTLTARTDASTTAPAYATKLVKGQTLTVTGKVNGFYQVKLADGMVAYASASYINVAK